MKKVITVLLVLLMILLALPLSASGEVVLGGDINGDKSVNNKDLTRFFQYLSDWRVSVNTAVLDVNGDGAVNNKDLTRLFQYLSGWDVSIFPETVCDHVEKEWVVTKPETVKTDGEKALICKQCGKVLETQVIPKSKPQKYLDLEAGMLGLMNEARAAEGIDPLTFDYERQAATDIRVEEITEVLSHTRPDGRIYYTVLDDLGLSFSGTCGENIAYFGYYSMDSDTTAGYTKLHNQFMNSPGHKSNVLNRDFKSVALSFIIKNNRLYVVQMFFG
ncbi:MAG: hypothetical protein IKZ47_02615 [Clostridia bacterium]|nr:hypothetical protein [Clostridia bacterium]